MIHGEKSIKTITVNNGRLTFFKTVRFCSVHGEIDTILQPDQVWNIKHAECHPEHFHDLKVNDRGKLSAAQNFEILKKANEQFELKKRDIYVR